MAVKKNETKKEKKVDKKAILFSDIGTFLAASEGADIVRIKQKGTPEFLLVTHDGKDYTVNITEKKANVDYDEDDVVETYVFVEPDEDEDESTEETDENGEQSAE